MALIRALSGSSGGGAKHIECGFGGSYGEYWTNRTVVSNDGEITLGNWGNYSVTILKKCTVITRGYNQTQSSSYTANVGDTINTPMDGSRYNGSIMLIEE